MSSLRDLFEESILQEAPGDLYKKGMDGIIGYRKRLKAGGQWKGGPLGPGGEKVGKRSPNPYHDALGRFTNLGKTGSKSPRSVSFGKGAARVALRGRKVTKEITGTGDDVGRGSGSGKPRRSNKTGGYQSTGRANEPSGDRVLARTGSTKSQSGDEGLAHVPELERIKHLRNLWPNFGKGKAKKGKPKAQRGKGKKALAASFDSDDLFMNRLLEGDQEHPLAYVAGALGSAQEALEMLYDMPGGDEYEEVVEAAEHLKYATQLLHYEEGFDEDEDWY